MDYQRIEFLGIFLNITCIFIWGITILYLFITKKKGEAASNKKGRKGNMRPFDEEIFAQMVKQESERSYNKIVATIKRERQRLWALIERRELAKAKNLLLRQNSTGVKKINSQKNVEKSYPKTDSMKKYSEVIRGADSGMTTKRISEEVKRPKGEIDLLVKLRKKKHVVNLRKPSGFRAFS